jgi:hypothetical protein
MTKLFFITGMICLTVATAKAQTKITGTVTCPGKSAQSLALPVGDKPGHIMSIAEDRCTWSKPFQLNGSPVKESNQVSFNEMNGSSTKGYGFDSGTTASGDKYFVRYEGPATLQNGIMVRSSGTWSFTGGTGKLATLKGKGTYTCKGSATSSSCDVVGEYQLAP